MQREVFGAAEGRRMAEGESPVDGGVRYEGTAGKIAASEKTVEGVLHTADVISERFFAWSERNPTQFYAVLACLVAWILIRSRTRIKIAAQKREYAARREEPRGQLPLPLPRPPQNGAE